MSSPRTTFRGVEIEGFTRDLIGTVVDTERLGFAGLFVVDDLILYSQMFGETDAPFVRMVPQDRRGHSCPIQIHYSDFQKLQQVTE